ncbi:MULTISPECIES: hypothetical protein [unclassified Mycoplasma]|uniref:hypothetical protein n=1 Tax=Mycoplasma sp. 125 TaxID=3447505 RepID=UPI003F65894F
MSKDKENYKNLKAIIKSDHQVAIKLIKVAQKYNLDIDQNDLLNKLNNNQSDDITLLIKNLIYLLKKQPIQEKFKPIKLKTDKQLEKLIKDFRKENK